MQPDFPLLPVPKTVWVLVERGLTGTRKPCEAIAQELALPYRVIDIDVPQPWRTLAPWVTFGMPLPLTAPWPDLVISGGRLGAAAALWVKRKNPQTKIVQLLNPHVSPARFDLVVRPQHDAAPRTDNLIETMGMPCRIDTSAMEADESMWRPILAPYPMPRLLLLLGGPRSKAGWDAKQIAVLKRHLYRWMTAERGALFVASSRRTPAGVVDMLSDGLPQDRVWAWDGTGANPYYALLSFADAVAVTGESVSMLSEIATLGKPLYSLSFESLPDKFVRFNRTLEEAGIAKIFTGHVDNWTYQPLDEAQRVAKHISTLLSSTQNT